MSSNQEIADSKVFTVYSWFQSEMRRVGRKIKFPKCSDKTKTYQFRWTKSFVKKCNEMELDDKIIHILVTDIVNYAKSRRLLDRGTQILCMGNITDVCYQGLKDLADDEVSLIEELRSCRTFLHEQVNDKDILVRRLIESETGGCSNLLYWYNLGRLTEVFMALSNSCTQALAKLPEGEREELPSKFKLLRICTHTVSDDLLPKLAAVMGSDLRVPPTVSLK
jgi:hypothetical protein